MDEQAQLRALLDLAEAVGIAVRYAARGRGEEVAVESSAGALVILRGREILFLDSSAPLADRIAVAAAALKGRTRLEDVFLPPEIRQLIDRA